MSGVITSIEGLNAISQATGTYDFVSYANFYNTGNVKGLQLIKSTGKTLGTTGTWGEIIPYTGNVTGGASKGVSAINFSSKSAGSLTASRSGALISIPAVQLVGAILAGLGLGIVAYEANPALWVEVSNRIFSIIPGYEPITADELPYLSFTTLFKNGKTHVPDYLVTHSADVLNELNAFNTQVEPIFNIEDLIIGQEITVNTIGFSADTLLPAYGNLLKNIEPNARLPYINIQTAFTHFLNRAIEIGALTIDDINNYDSYFFNLSLSTSGSKSSYGFELAVFNCAQNAGIVNFNNGEYATINMYDYVGTSALGKAVSGSVWSTIDEPNVPLGGVNSYGGVNRNGYGIFKQMPIGYKYEKVSSSFHRLTYTGFNASYIIKSGLDGVTFLEGAIVPSTFPIEIPSLFPLWWASRIDWSNLNPEIQTNPLADPFIEFGYLPLAVPNANPLTVPVETPQPVIQAGEVPATNPEPVVEGTQPVIDDMEDKELPSGGGGDTPTVPVIPPLGGTATALYTVYNPTKEQLNQLGAYLWSEDALSILQQLFQNPLESVIGLHILYATPATGESRNIKLGYLNSGVSAKEVTNQYINIDCGSIVVPEYFGDARDYSPYTQVNVFLPFIGIRQLDTNEVMGGTMSIDYKIDVLTGTCLCMINVSKLGYSQVLYTFEGNCAVQLPLTGADKSRLLTGVIGGAFAGGMIGGTGGAVVGAVKGAIGGIKIQKTGSIGSNAGAMGIKKPYIIITRQKPYDAYNYNEQYGYPANMTVQLSSCTGFTRVKDVHVENILVATQEEKDMIQTLLRQGVIIE